MQLLVLENQGGEKFFGEPALELKDFMKTDRDGRGYVNILAADKLMGNPRLYATFLLWLLSELFEELPEVGDPDKPKLVFFFDEAHLLFDEAPKALLDKIEQVVRLVRSKGVGVYFVTQNPLDVPDKVLAQLGNRVQHALARLHPARSEGGADRGQHLPRQSRSSIPAKVIMELGKGEALVSFLDEQGHAVDGRALHDPSAVRPDGSDHAGRALCDHGEKPGQGKIRHHDRQRVRLREARQARRARGGARGPGSAGSGGGITDWIGGIFGTNRKRGETLTDWSAGRTYSDRDRRWQYRSCNRPEDRRTHRRLDRPHNRAQHNGRDFAAIKVSRPGRDASRSVSGVVHRRAGTHIL